ncbi:hypothetical protein AX17_002413 [Amanita inopinata Kibby_2008]|nr:hypothetical protein AX17_002413 [Amanita inopinata Kibby_2008]
MRFSIVFIATAVLLACLGSAVSTTNHNDNIAGYKGGFDTSAITRHQLAERDVKDLYFQRRAPVGPPHSEPRPKGHHRDSGSTGGHMPTPNQGVPPPPRLPPHPLLPVPSHHIYGGYVPSQGVPPPPLLPPHPLLPSRYHHGGPVPNQKVSPPLPPPESKIQEEQEEAAQRPERDRKWSVL